MVSEGRSGEGTVGVIRNALVQNVKAVALMRENPSAFSSGVSEVITVDFGVASHPSEMDRVGSIDDSEVDETAARGLAIYCRWGARSR